MTLILVLYVDGILLIGNEHMMIKVRGSQPLKFEMKNLGTINYFLEFGKENIYREDIEEFLEGGNENPWTFQLNFKKLCRDITGHDFEINN